ncbi:MAG TPA: ATPase, T2SS/T4P/T4SS family [Candidatus Omnitrophota bacterium]|nr:ATPase, T2SS/T4P/T4SS family [Candidatus Omnitrophota bacterium]
MYKRIRLGERLVEEGLITQEQFDVALKKHQETKMVLRQVLVDMGFITEEKLIHFMSECLHVPVARELSSLILDPGVIKLIPENHCRQYMVMPLSKEGDTLQVAMADPFDVFAIDDIEGMAKSKIEVVLCRKEEILRAIDKFYHGKERLHQAVTSMAQEADRIESKRQTKVKKVEPKEQIIETDQAPIIKMVNTMITEAVKARASDIHIEPEEEVLRVRYRVDGGLREAMTPPKHLQEIIISRIKIMAGIDISIKRTPQDGRFKMNVEEKEVDVRVSTVPTTYGETVVMRLLDPSVILKDLKNSGFGDDVYTKFRELIERPFGIVLVTGPTGSGKSTTLYLALQTINTADKNIITIEEPVEYEIKGVNQIAVNVKAGVTFAKGLRSILRQDPDVIMVGEMRDTETADIAVRAALTGHLVFSTLHTNDAASSIVRLVDMGIPLYLVISSVCGILAQRLVRMICPKCKESYQPTPEELKRARLEDATKTYTFYRGKGCDACGKTGYYGRIGIFELMVLNKELRSVIQAGKSSDEIQEAARKAGMKLLWEDGMEKALQGLTTLEEVNKVTFIEAE